MKKTVAIILVLITIFTLSSCARKKGDAPQGMKTVSGDNSEFYLYIPDSWVNTTPTYTDKEISSIAVSARVSDSDPSNISFVGFVDGNGEYASIDKYWEHSKSVSKYFDEVIDEESGEKKTSFALATDGEAMTVGGLAAKKYEYSGVFGGSNFKFMQVIIKDGNVFYTFTYTSTPDLYSRNLDHVEAILDHIEFK